MDSITKNLLIFRSPQKAIGMYDTLFGGIFLRDSLIVAEKWAVLGLLFLIPLLILAASKLARRDILTAARIFCAALFTLLVVMLNTPVDEVFINLRHSFHLAAYNLFSFNLNAPTEGIVDFLPYAFLGLLHKLYLPLEELTFVQSWLGGLLCLWACHRLLRELEVPALPRGFMLLALSVFPPLIYNSALGFSSSIFCAAILWAIYFLHFKAGRQIWGKVVLSIVPLIRLEGVFYTGLEFLRMVRSEKLKLTDRRLWKLTATLFGPITILSAWRFRTYGSPIPLPIQYKSSFGNLFFLRKGLTNLWLDASFTYVVPMLILAGVLYWATSRSELKARVRQITQPLWLLSIFVLPYYLSGGDWFSPAWARYLLPLAVFAFTAGSALFYLALVEGNYFERKLTTAVTALTLVGYLFLPSSFGTLAQSLRDSSAGRGSSRIQQLSMLGMHLERTTRANQTIASSEVASIMYFAEREALDLLGVTNAQIVKEPLNEISLFRRHKPSLVASLLPDYLYPGDYITRLLPPNATREQILSELRRLHGTYATWENYFFGGPENLEKLGYSPIFVLYGNQFGALYYASKDALAHHLDALKREGFVADPPVEPPTVQTL